MEGLRSGVARLARERSGHLTEANREPTPPLDEFHLLVQQLADQGLHCDQTLILIAHDGVRVAFDAEGQPVRAPLFDAITAPLALFTPGAYAHTYALRGCALRASIDDAAQLFGATLPCVDEPATDGPAYLIRRRGMLVTGRFASELVAAAMLVDKLCHIELAAPLIGRVHRLNPALCTAEHAVYRTTYSRRQAEDAAGIATVPPVETTSTAMSPEALLRHDVIAYGQRLVDEHLIQATWGNVSVRVDDEHFLISPSGVDYHAVTPDEVALVNLADGSYAKGLHPSSERRMHQLIYQLRPDIQAIVHTHSAHCAVYAACHKDLLTDVLDYPCAPYAVSGSQQLAVNVSRVMLGHDGAILANHGVVTAGSSLEQAFERAREAEIAAGRGLEA